jgi:Xaa-Pro aminopeptidase
MEESDIELLNDYHRQVFEKLSPYFHGEELEKLKSSTSLF